MRTTSNGSGLRFQQLDVYRVARELVVRVGALGLRDPELRSQAHRAATSVLLNLSEGLPSFSAGLRHRFFTTARGSVFEVAAAIDAAAALGMVEPSEADAITALCDRLGAMLYRLMR